jgi:hypothetical protein
LTDYWMAFCHPSTTAPATNPASWSEVRLTDTWFNLEQAPARFAPSENFFLGDYEGLAAAGNDFVAVWGMPNGTGTNQESIFFRTAVSHNAHRLASTSTLLVASTPATSTRPTAGTNGGTSQAPVLASPLPGRSRSDGTVVIDSSWLGGALANILDSTLTVGACTLTGYLATGGAGAADGNGGNGFGGGIYNDGQSNLTVTGTSITGNEATGGAASTGGSAGQGIGGGVYLASGGVGCLDAYTLANVLGNMASTGNNDVFGAFTIC